MSGLMSDLLTMQVGLGEGPMAPSFLEEPNKSCLLQVGNLGDYYIPVS